MKNKKCGGVVPGAAAGRGEERVVEGNVGPGEAELEVEIDLGLFSKSATIHYSRTFAGSNGDPTFAQLMEPYSERGVQINPWKEYCQAFV